MSRRYIPSHLFVVATAWGSRIVNALIQLASVRVLMGALGTEQYAIFAILTGLTGWFMLADLGIGVSVQNYISESRAKDQPYDDLIAISGLLAVLLMLLMVIALYFLSPYIAPLLLKNFLLLSEGEKTKLFFLTSSFSIGLGVGSIVYKVWYAEQRGYLSNIVPALASLIGFVGLLLVRRVSHEDRLFLSLMVFIVPTAVLPFFALLLQQMKCSHKYSRKKMVGTVNKIIKRGVHFWFFAVMSAGVLQIDYIVVSQFLSYHDITVYSLSMKIFGLVSFIYSAVLLALWPVLTEAIARRQWFLVRQYLKKSLIFGFVFIFICTMLLIWLMPIAVGMLAPNGKILIPINFILLVGAYLIVRVWTDTFAMVLQSMSDLKSLSLYVPIQAILSIGLQWSLTPIYGLYGIIFGLIGSFVFTVIWALPLAVQKHYHLHQRTQS